MSHYTTQGLMTSADMADLADLCDWNLEARESQAEEDAMEAAHVAHADDCQECQELDGQRETTARVALQMDTARRGLEKGIRETLKDLRELGPQAATLAQVRLERALKEAQDALRSI